MTRSLNRLMSSCSHLALWASLYVTGAVVCFGQLSGLGVFSGHVTSRSAACLAFAFMTAAAVYLLDRVKLRNYWLDPADEAAHPERFGFLARHAAGARGLAFALCVGSMVVGACITPAAPLLTLGACAGVLAYAGRPRRARARIKDVFLLKNAFVGAGITGFAVLVAVCAAGGGRSLGSAIEILGENIRPVVLAAAQLLLRVFADAAVCDLDDEHADRSYRTATLPTRFGRFKAWNIAAGTRIVLGLALLLIPIGPASARLAWGCVTIVSTVALRAWNPRRVREAVDARLAMEALLVWAVLAWLGR